MSFLNKIFKLFGKKDNSIVLIENNVDLYKLVTDNMEILEKNDKNSLSENIKVLTAAVKTSIVEIQILKEAIKNQNQVIMNLTMINQRFMEAFENSLATEEMLEVELQEEEEITESATEKTKRELAKKHGVN